MNQKKIITLLVIAVIILSITTVYFATTKNQSAINEVAQQLTQPASPKNQSSDKAIEWKNFSRNGNALSFKYPSKWCYDNTDCGNNLYVTEIRDTLSIGQIGKESITNVEIIEPILLIYYVTSLDQINSLDQNGAEKYLRDKYETVETISWVADKTNPGVVVIDSSSNLGRSRVYAAYSKEFGALVSFSLQPACLFDCQIDREVLNSIKLDGVSVYQENLPQ